MTRVCSSSVALLAAWMFAGCHSGSGDVPPPGGVLLPSDSVVLELDGKAFQAGCANGKSGGGFLQGATCGSASIGAGPIFHSLECNDDPSDQHAPIYFLGTTFRGLDPAGVDGDLTFDLSDPAHEESVTVMMNYMDLSRTEYHYCTAPPRDADGGAYPPSSGIVTLHRFVPDGDSPPGVRISDAEVTNAIVPSLDGGPPITIVAAHLYFQ
ncbi:MAG: hypothetical protein JWM53_3831 [bacterium]|nr:hypothetical protein [bacterium]